MDCDQCFNKYVNEYPLWCIHFEDKPPAAKIKCVHEEPSADHPIVNAVIKRER